MLLAFPSGFIVGCLDLNGRLTDLIKRFIRSIAGDWAQTLLGLPSLFAGFYVVGLALNLLFNNLRTIVFLLFVFFVCFAAYAVIGTPMSWKGKARRLVVGLALASAWLAWSFSVVSALPEFSGDTLTQLALAGLGLSLLLGAGLVFISAVMLSVLLPTMMGSRIALMLLSGVELFGRASGYLKAMSAPAAGLVFTYGAVAIWFAGVYGWLHHGSSADTKLFDGLPQDAPVWEYIFFSIMVMSTLGGFTRLYPVSGLGQLIVASQVLISLLLTAVVFAGVLAYLQPIFERLTKRRRFVALAIGDRFFLVEPSGLRPSVSVVVVKGNEQQFELLHNETVFGASVDITRTEAGYVVSEWRERTRLYELEFGRELAVKFDTSNWGNLLAVISEERVRLQDPRTQHELVTVSTAGLGGSRAALAISPDGAISDRTELPRILRDSLLQT